MAQPYQARLSQIVNRLELPESAGTVLESTHFFSGAALYANGKICASLSSAGLALKLPEQERDRLLEENKGEKFRFFPKGPIKREYILLSESTIADEQMLLKLLKASTDYVLGRDL